ncbi:MAG TPA: PQQ-binding-like beta-propeller repeat protein, partial [Chitinophagaceae bacterium]
MHRISESGSAINNQSTIMRIFFLSLLCMEMQVATAQQPAAISPLFQRVTAANDNKVYDTKAWAFQSGAPVRSTTLVNGNYVYFGNAEGNFYCIQKKTGSLKWKFSTGQPIHSSALATAGKIFFSDNKQTVYALDENNGKLLWKFEMGA